MEPEKRLKIYTAFADNTRKWASVMDTKAGFVFTVNAVLIGFLWTGGKFTSEWPLPYMPWR